MIISHPLLLRERNIPDNFVEKINTHVLRSITVFYEIMWKNIVQRGRP
jgi:hypothetical protein